MTTPLGDETEFTELVDADVPRVDLVGQAANGSAGFLLMKQDARGLIDPQTVRDLIGKAATGPQPATEEQVTMTGSPAAIARLIHQAAVAKAEPVAKAKYDAADLKRMAGNGEAMPDEGYPIADREDLANAIRAVGRGGANHDAIRRHIETRAKALGASSEIPDNWAADGSLKEGTVAKMDMDPDETAMDPTVVLAEPAEDAPGDPTDPGSPAWEAVDAATARKWTAILARARSALGVMSDRETLEAATVDPDDAENAWDLDDAACAIDYAISVLAPFAVDEQAEADCGTDMAMVGKALAGFDPAPLDTIEALAHVAKAGRTLSAANEQAIRSAADSLQQVLASLPAPTEESGRAVAKTANEEPTMPEPTLSEDVTAASGQQPAMGTQEPEPKPVAGVPVTEMAKADGDKPEMVAVFNANGRLVGIVDPTKITPVSGADADADKDAAPAAAAPAEPAAPETTDLTPAPAAEVGTPADAVPDDDTVTKTTNDTTSDEVLKSIVEAKVEAALNEYKAAQKEDVSKQATDLAHMAELVETLKGQVKALEEQPAMPKVFTNGATPPRDMLRGQDRGANAAPVDVTKAAELKKQLYSGQSSGEQQEAFLSMQEMAIAKLAELHSGK